MTLDQLHQRTYGAEAQESLPVDVVLYSADSHVIEPADLWAKELPTKLRKEFEDVTTGLARRADHRGDPPIFGGGRPDDVKHPGGTDKNERLRALDADGVSIEVLYGTWGLKLLAIDDPNLEAACVKIYNDWLIDFCQAAPDRLIGLAILSCYDIDGAIAEMARCRDAGMRGISVWQIPRDDLRFSTDHYDRLWAAAQEMGMPVSLHILSGHGYRKHPEMMPTSTDMTKKLAVCMDSIHDIIFSGVLERFPGLRVIMAENEIGWLPWVLEQWDFYVHKGRHHFDYKQEELKLLPSEYFQRQMYATFFNDAVGGRLLSWWGQDNCMWSNDFPHSNSTWPVSRDVIARDLGDLPQDVVAKIVHGTCANLYDLPLP
jgi:predicted TIM-barrel fold metal-dependent hydrolase